MKRIKLACGQRRHIRDIQEILADPKCLGCFSGMVKLCEEEKRERSLYRMRLSFEFHPEREKAGFAIA